MLLGCKIKNKDGFLATMGENGIVACIKIVLLEN